MKPLDIDEAIRWEGSGPHSRERGWVLRFNAAKGHGRIKADRDGEVLIVMFHEIRGEGFRSLDEGQRVEFLRVPAPNGWHAQDVEVLPNPASTAQAPRDAAADYKARILSYQAGSDFLAVQASAPARLASLIDGLSAEEIARRPAPDKWSIQEIVAHLADDELVGGYRIRLILSSPGTEIQAFDQDVWSRTGRYDRTDVRSSLELFRVLREANLWLFRSLRPEEWDISGVHAERGVESIRDIAMYYAGHDINHFKQIEAIRSSER